jgi:hypothetical protein
MRVGQGPFARVDRGGLMGLAHSWTIWAKMLIAYGPISYITNGLTSNLHERALLAHSE